MEKVVNPGTEEEGFYLSHIKGPGGEQGPEQKGVRKHFLLFQFGWSFIFERRAVSTGWPCGDGPGER